jgi:diguanylate cyclase (GGDEF)-like protein
MPDGGGDPRPYLPAPTRPPLPSAAISAAVVDGRDQPIPGVTVYEELGHGTQAVVYRARRYGVDYAVKVLRASVFAEESVLTSFRREAALLACVDHPGVVSVYEVGQVHGRPYLVMELVQGQTLAEAMLTRLSEAKTIAIALDVAGALAAAHRAGLTHRDVKPQNIMILPDGHAKIIDFGLAALASGVARGGVAGTFAYSAPEQTGMLNRIVDGRSDLYSLGVVLFHCLTGQLPFTAANVGELLRQHTVEAAPDVRHMRPEVSPGLAAVVAKLLSKDPDDRYQSGDGLAADLHELARQRLDPADLGRADTPVAAGESPLVGRHAQIEELRACWSQARAGRGGVAVVAGPPGAGKTRLVRELVSAASGAGHLVLQGKCYPDDPMPMSPIRSAVERYVTEIDKLPSDLRDEARSGIRRAAGRGASLLGAVTPALARVIDAPELADEHRQEQFAVAVATFLVGLAREAGGAILYLDDVQWLDDGTRRVLHHLGGDLSGCPLLVAATSRDDLSSRRAHETFVATFPSPVVTHIALNPLSDAAMGRLLRAQLGGAALTPELTSALTSRSEGNPFTAEEYVRAIVDEGLIRPSWGTWQLDEAGLHGVDLPDNVLELIGARVAGLGSETRDLLVTAAAAAFTIRPAELGYICDLPEDRVRVALRLAVDRRLMAAGRDGSYTFLHDRVREALLGDLHPGALRDVHQRIAEALDRRHSGDPEYGYAIARHYELGDPARDPERAYRALVSAGLLALGDHAPHQALEFLRAADAAATVGGVAKGIEFHETYGIACVRVGRFAEARGHLHAALAAETAPVRRAMLYGMVCESHQSDWELSEALSAGAQALAELGRGLPRNRAVLVLSTMTRFLVSLLVQWTGIGHGTATGEKRERFRIEAVVLMHSAQAAVSAHRMALVACLQFRQLYPANRIGPGPEYVKAHATMAAIAKMMGLRRLSARKFRRVSAVATALADPRLVACVDWVSASIEATLRNSRVSGTEVMRRLLTEHGRWLDAMENFNATSILCNWLTQQGHTVEAQAWYDRTRIRANEVQPGQGHHMALVTVPIRAINGHADEAERQLAAARAYLATRTDNREQMVTYLMQSLVTAVELGELGERFEELARVVAAMGLSPRNTWPAQHQIWVSLAYGRLAQVLAAPKPDRPAHLARAEPAVRDMAAAATTPVLKVHLLIIRASFALLGGEPATAMRLLEQAERRTWVVDAPVLDYEINRVRARVLQTMGLPSQARRYAGLALQWANECGWETRARTVQAEFSLGPSNAHTGIDAGRSVAVETYRRRIEALQQVSLAAATVLDPRELARIALQETIGIIRAERAFLFLVDGVTGRLVPYVGRDSSGADLDELTGFGGSLVRRVRDTGEPLLVTGTEEGELLGSQSTVALGLSSILVAPVRLKGRLMGVVYLDSRIAKGIFTRDDVDILMAITNQVAVSLETARAAQLEVEVRAASEQRDLAELLRSSMTQFSTTLDPDEVLRRLMAAVSRALPGEGACLLRHDGGGYVVAEVSGRVPATAVGRRLSPDEAESVTALADQASATLGAAAAGRPEPPADLLPTARSLITVPLATRGTSIGVLMVASATAGAYTDAHVRIAAALAGQAMSTYDNADLFAQVNRLATVDPMTGLCTRRQFLALADVAVSANGSAGLPMSAIMIDIDHFKRVNDSYGHLVGDQVIEEVGARLRSAMRDGDIVGRYGGEEFALLLPAGPGPAREVADRLLDLVARTPIETSAGPLHITVSVGLAHGAAVRDLGALLDRADQALYRAKRRGRNQVVAD